MAAVCFDTLLRALNPRHVPNSNLPPLPDIRVGGMFVIWKTETGALTGCIGCLSHLSLRQLTDYALRAVTKDSRLKPIIPSEVPKLVCCVSILHSFEPIDRITDWEIGTHGIQIKFETGSQEFHSTFLPEVADEQNWDQTETLTFAIKKAGYHGTLDSVRSSLIVKRYQSSKVSITYPEFLGLKSKTY